MGADILRVFLDLAVLAALGTTLFYALRLKHSLDLFRATRKEFDSVMRELTRHTNEAFRAIEALKDASEEGGAALQRKLNESRTLMNDLEIMNGSADALARRLENMADKSLRLAQGLDDPDDYTPPMKPSPAEAMAPGTMTRMPFVIRDREHEATPTPAASKTPPDFSSPDLRSKAERDLFEALQKSQRAPGAKGQA